MEEGSTNADSPIHSREIVHYCLQPHPVQKNPRDGVHSDACTDLPSRRHEANKIKWILRRLLHYSGPEREERVDLTPLGRTGVVAYCWMGGPPMEQGGTGER